LLFNVTGRPQKFNLSCESRSASDLAQYWGREVPEEEFLNRLPRSDNPHYGFVGSPDDPRGGLPPNGYGVYAEPVAALLTKYGLPARAEFGRGLDWLRREVAAGRPVIVWSTYDFKPQPVQEFKDDRGREFSAVPFEHTYLVVGYAPAGFYAIDAYDAQRKFYTLSEFETGWSLLGQMAVSVRDPEEVAASSGSRLGWGVPLLIAGLLVTAFVFWRSGGQLPGTRRQRPIGRRVPPSREPPTRKLDPWEQFQSTLSGLIDDLSKSGPDRVGRYAWAQTVGIGGLAVGLLITFALGRFNPCMGVPIVVTCGVAGFALGYALERRRS
jgi:uncharacterized protein YvpB